MTAIARLDMSKQELATLGREISVCADKARARRKQADNLEDTAAARLREAEKLCVTAGRSFVHWVKRGTGMTYREARGLMYRRGRS